MFGNRSDGTLTSGPLLIIAGAGTGKTNTLAHRVAYLILSGVRPERLMAHCGVHRTQLCALQLTPVRDLLCDRDSLTPILHCIW